MDVTPLPTVQEIREWMQLPSVVDAAVEKLAAAAYDIRQAVAGCYTNHPVGVYLHPDDDATAWLMPDPRSKTAVDADGHDPDIVRVKQAIDSLTSYRATGGGREEDARFVKVAYSPALRRVSELGNFFSGKYPGGIPNTPGPVASMLTSGLVGAGLGYGAGWVGEQLMPDQWEKGKLRKTLATLGGVAGMAPGAVWGGVNKLTGRNFNDNSLLSGQAGSDPQMLPGLKLAVDLNPAYVLAARRYCEERSALPEELVKLADAGASEAEMAGYPDAGVNVDAMGRTLWLSGTDPRTAGTTMAVLAAASRMPGGGDAGFVTPAQMGNLAAHMGAGYASGALVGSALGALAGMPQEAQDMLARSGMYLGIVKELLPQIFGAE